MKTRPFNFEEAKAGKPVVNLKHELPVEIIDFNFSMGPDRPGLAYKMTMPKHTCEQIMTTSVETAGVFLRMKVEAKTLWVNTYKLRPHINKGDRPTYIQYSFESKERANLCSHSYNLPYYLLDSKAVPTEVEI